MRNFKATTGRTFALIDSGLLQPMGLALDHDRGALYVADASARKILRFHVPPGAFFQASRALNGMASRPSNGSEVCTGQGPWLAIGHRWRPALRYAGGAFSLALSGWPECGRLVGQRGHQWGRLLFGFEGQDHQQVRK